MSQYFSKMMISRNITRLPWTNTTQKNGTSLACCMCYKIGCGTFLDDLRPSELLRTPLNELRKRLGPRARHVPMLHVRNSNETTLLGVRAWKADLSQVIGRLNSTGRGNLYSYAAVQQAADASQIRAAFPSIILQQDLRPEAQLSLGDRQSWQGLLSATFDMFALAMGSRVVGTATASTFSGVAHCLRNHSARFIWEPLPRPSFLFGKHF